MKVCIIGAGKVGFEIARRVTENGHDVVLVDRSDDRLDAIQERLDILTIRGNGGTARVMNDPAVACSDLLVAVTDSDEINIISCLEAKRRGIAKTIARVREPDYAYDFFNTKAEWGIDLFINPDLAAASEIARQLILPLAIHTESFGNGKILMTELVVDNGSEMLRCKRLQDIDLPKSTRVVAISREGDMLVPGGEDTLMPGDIIYILGNLKSISELSERIKGKKRRVQNVMILGGSRIGYYLATKLHQAGVKNIKLIEQQRDRCDELAERLPDTLVLRADGTDIDFLQQEGIQNVDGFVAVTGLDEENLLISLLAKQMGAKQVIAKVSRPGYTALVERLGVDSSISPRLITVSEILRFISGGKLLSLFMLLNGKAEVVEMVVETESKLVNKSLKKAGFPKGVIIGAILRGNEAIIPEGDEVIRAGDRLVVFTVGNYLHQVESMVGVKV